VIIARQFDTSAGRAQEPGNQVEQGAFTGAAWPENRNAFARPGGKRKPHRQMVVKPGYISER